MHQAAANSYENTVQGTSSHEWKERGRQSEVSSVADVACQPKASRRRRQHAELFIYVWCICKRIDHVVSCKSLLFMHKSQLYRWWTALPGGGLACSTTKLLLCWLPAHGQPASHGGCIWTFRVVCKSLCVVSSSLFLSRFFAPDVRGGVDFHSLPSFHTLVFVAALLSRVLHPNPFQITLSKITFHAYFIPPMKKLYVLSYKIDVL